MPRTAIRLVLILAAAFVLAACDQPPADHFYAVNTTADTVDVAPGDGACADAAGDCSLRAAVMESNADVDIDLVVLSADATYALTIPGAGEDLSATGDLDLLESTYIQTFPATGTPAVIDASAIGDRVVDVRGGNNSRLEHVELTGGSAVDGGAVRHSAGLLRVLAHITGNTATGSGSALVSTSGIASFDRSTVANNTGPSAVAVDGGIVFLTESTVSGNSGVGIDSIAGLANVSFTTVTNNAGGLAGPVTLAASIVADQASGPDCMVAPTSDGGNVDSDGSCNLTAATDLSSANPLLGPLLDNGGPYPTHLPAATSPVLQLVPSSALGCGVDGPVADHSTDQRGVARPNGAGCEPGSVEAEVAACVIDGQSVITSLPQIECDALFALQDGSFVFGWIPQFGPIPDPCTWTGVTCGSGHVVSLDMPEFVQSVAPEIGDLDHLVTLDLSFASLNTLPAEIGSMAALETLTLYRSHNGPLTLPAGIGTSPSLVTLSIVETVLAPLPASIGDIATLETLVIVDTGVGSLPSTLGSLTNLRTLTATDNAITSLPATIGDLSALQVLNLSDNAITALPASIGDLAALRDLRVESNQLTALPATIGDLGQLRELRVSFNPIAALPAEIGQLVLLQGLQARFMNLTALPPEIGDLANLRVLNVQNNSVAALPTEIGQLDALRTLAVDFNLLTALPDELSDLDSLTTLGARFNNLTGDITAPMIGLQDTLQFGWFDDSIGNATQNNNCLTVTDPQLDAFLDALPGDWDFCQ